MQPRILIADDQQDVLDALRLLLKSHGYSTELVNSPAALLAALSNEANQFDLILMDLNYARDTTSGREGLDVLGSLTSREDAPPVVAMTGWATVGLAVETMQFGVSDFIEKPWNNLKLLEILQKQITLGAERRALQHAAKEEKRSHEATLLHLREKDRELAEARAIQQGLLPRELPQISGYQLASSWQSAGTVGGDYFDVLALSDDTYGICIADVAGKGMPAAFLMSNLQAAVRALSSPAVSPDILCARLNSLMVRNTAEDRFITFFYAHLQQKSRRLVFANCGHNAPFVLHRDGSVERLQQGGTVLGVFADHVYASGVAQLEPGDRLVLFTDGVTEACDREEQEFGETRLLQVLRENVQLFPDALQKKIIATVADFNGGHWADDATLLICSVE